MILYSILSTCSTQGISLPKGRDSRDESMREGIFHPKPSLPQPEFKRLDKDGYKIVRVIKDGKVVWMAEHRLKMIRHLGRMLSPNECVHHRDGNKLNNSDENLTIVDRDLHDIHALSNARAVKRVLTK